MVFLGAQHDLGAAAGIGVARRCGHCEPVLQARGQPGVVGARRLQQPVEPAAQPVEQGLDAGHIPRLDGDAVDDRTATGDVVDQRHAIHRPFCGAARLLPRVLVSADLGVGRDRGVGHLDGVRVAVLLGVGRRREVPFEQAHPPTPGGKAQVEAQLLAAKCEGKLAPFDDRFEDAVGGEGRHRAVVRLIAIERSAIEAGPGEHG